MIAKLRAEVQAVCEDGRQEIDENGELYITKDGFARLKKTW